MRVNNLSIGDWVCAKEFDRITPPMKVVGLGESWVNLEIDPEQGDPFEYLPPSIQGVEITPEIFEKNNWSWDGMYAHYRVDDNRWLEYYLHERRLTMWWKGVDEYNNHAEVTEVVFRSHCYYVHQLQHSLRLVGCLKEIEL